MNAVRRAWDEFWQEQSRSGSACLEHAPAPLRSALTQHWREFAATLPRRASVLDLGCGSGAVGRAIASCRSDLRLYGVDYAVMGRVRDGAYVAIKTRTAMEALPYETARFEGATSQFGFEYSRFDESVIQLARVMAPGGRLSLIVHHAEGLIVVDNRRSLLACRQLLSPRMERLFVAGDRSGVEEITTAAASNFDLTGQYVAQSLRQRVAAPRSVRMKSWRAIELALRPEFALATALDRSAVGHAAIDRWVAGLGDYFEDRSFCPLQVGGVPFAWRIEARRSKAAPITKSYAAK